MPGKKATIAAVWIRNSHDFCESCGFPIGVFRKAPHYLPDRTMKAGPGLKGNNSKFHEKKGMIKKLLIIIKGV
jgi:hypothetical protein